MQEKTLKDALKEQGFNNEDQTGTESQTPDDGSTAPITSTAGMSEDEIMKAAKEAQVDHFVRSLPGGYEMELNEEASNVSAGEKQLLTIARAMLAKTPMLILDEATSSVDTRTEVQIQKAMDNLMEGKTSFVIAHRLSTIRNADLILVMNDGNVIEQGTHDSLMKQAGFYAKLYNSQFETS